jgi:putative copper resistance protein D
MVFGLMAIRWLHWTACLLLASSQLYGLWLPRNERSEGSSVRAWSAEFSSRPGRLARAAWALALLSLMLWFGLTAWNMNGPDAGFDLSSMVTVAVQTQFGRVSLARLALLTLTGFCLFSSRSGTAVGEGRSLRMGAIALAILSLLTLALTGHASATPGPAGIFHLLADALHLAAASVWPVGLVCFALLLRSCLRARPVPLVIVAAQATDRFSTSSLIAVAVLGATGLTMSLSFIHHLHDLWTSGYGQLLTAKVLIFLGMVAFGAWNLLVLRRKLGREVRSEIAGRPASTAHALFRNVFWEIVMGTAVLLIVALLGTTEPPVP